MRSLENRGPGTRWHKPLYYDLLYDDIIIYVYVCAYMYIYIYIYIEREREREREMFNTIGYFRGPLFRRPQFVRTHSRRGEYRSQTTWHLYVCVYIYIYITYTYIYIYIYMYVHGFLLCFCNETRWRACFC